MGTSTDPARNGPDRRLTALDAEVAARAVMVAYMAACDAHDADAVADLFHHDAVWIGTEGGRETARLRGREAVRAEYRTACARLTFCVHHLTNEELVVDDHGVEGRWCYLEPATNRGQLAVWTAGRYHHRFTEVDGVWRIASFTIETLVQAPYAEGWGRVAVVVLP
ncbi:MAG: hypothetical protein JWM47_1129 [Acidimicrobiales bacterium]|nr:hypothetical protein [Acidimicrobiales bacterium]